MKIHKNGNYIPVVTLKIIVKSQNRKKQRMWPQIQPHGETINRRTRKETNKKIKKKINKWDK